MQQNRLITLLQSIGPEKTGQFLKYLRQHHPNKEQAIKAIEYLKNEFLAHTDYPGDLLKDLQEKVFHNQITTHSIQNIFYRILPVFKEFSTHALLAEHPYLSDLLFLDYFREANLEKEYSKVIDENLEAFNETDPQAIIRPNIQKLIFLEKSYYNAYIKHEDRLKAFNRIDSMDQNLDTFYLTYKLKYLAEKLNYYYMTEATFQKREIFSPKILFQVAEEQAPHDDTLMLYYRTVRLFLKQHDNLILELTPIDKSFKELFEEVRLFLKNCHTSVALQDQKIVLRYLLNLSIQAYRNGDQRFHRTRLELIQDNLSNGLLLENGLLTEILFHNTIDVACAAEDLDYANTFLENWKGKLNKKNQEANIKLGKAQIALYREDYQQIDKLLSDIEPASIIFQLRSFWLMSITKFMLEKDSPEYLESYFDSIRHFLRTKQLNKELKLGTRKLLLFLKYLSDPTKSRKKLLQKLRETPVIFMRIWLEKAIKQLKS